MTAAMSDYLRHFFGWLDEFEATIRAPREAMDGRSPPVGRVALSPLVEPPSGVSPPDGASIAIARNGHDH